MYLARCFILPTLQIRKLKLYIDVGLGHSDAACTDSLRPDPLLSLTTHMLFFQISGDQSQAHYI